MSRALFLTRLKKETGKTNRYQHNQRHVGNFVAQKQLKGGWSCFDFCTKVKVLWLFTLWLAFDFCKSKIRFKSPTKGGVEYLQ
jgi:hypothetical protein